MYCGACARDAALARGLIARGHDVEVVPLYTPLKFDEEQPFEMSKVYLGGINAYLQQQSGLFRKLPPALDRWLDSPALLNWASKFAVKTRAEDLGPMTVSVLQGTDGRQKKEIERLIDHLRKGVKPDVVSITNTMLSGLAPALKEAFGAPIVCSFQGEEVFIGSLPEKHREKALNQLHRNAQHVDLFLTPSVTYGDQMAEFLGIGVDRVRLVRAGLDFKPLEPDKKRKAHPFRVCFVSTIARPKGLDLLAEAFVKFISDGDDSSELAIAGKQLNSEHFEEVMSTLYASCSPDRITTFGEVSTADKEALLACSGAFCVPSRIAESRGIAVLEAIGAGIPVVAPNTGIYPEMLGLTGGGLLFDNENVDDLARCLAELRDDAKRADDMGKAGAKGAREHFSSKQMVDQAVAAFHELVPQCSER
jgi:glycosyltransferase involved in cell wall biosynthesis